MKNKNKIIKPINRKYIQFIGSLINNGTSKSFIKTMILDSRIDITKPIKNK